MGLFCSNNPILLIFQFNLVWCIALVEKPIIGLQKTYYWVFAKLFQSPSFPGRPRIILKLFMGIAVYLLTGNG